MRDRDKPHFIIKKNLQKSASTGICFSDAVNEEVLKDACAKTIGRTDVTFEYVENDYTDEFLEPTYNKGRLGILLYQDTAFYISFSEAGIGGRNSSVQSVPTAYNLYCKYTGGKKQICYYFLDCAGNAETDYLIFMYRLMKTIGFRFLNAGEVLDCKIAPFISIEDIISSRRVNAGKNKSNHSTYITKSSSLSIEVYGKTYGANKYEAAMLCYALSCLASEEQKLTLYEVWDKDLKVLPQSCLETIKGMGKMEVIPTDMTLEKKAFEENNSLRSPRFIYNLFDKFGTKKCALCHCNIPELIQGAHIWPVASIKKAPGLTDEEKLRYAVDGENGLWLCENHHKLFDENLITFTRRGELEWSPAISAKQRTFMEEITTIPYLCPKYLTNSFLAYLEKRYKAGS